ncbi:hypothetical protein PS15m_005790 [Mucor circinelloides]
MYALNKKIHRQSIPDQSPSIDANLMQAATNPTTVIQGIDLDIVTAASGHGEYCKRKIRATNGKILNCQKKASCVKFTGNWSGSDTYIKGPSRRSTNPNHKQLDVGIKDSVVPTNELE